MKSAKTAYLIVICSGVILFWLGNIFYQKGLATGQMDTYKWFTLACIGVSVLFAMSFGFLYAGKIKYAIKTGLLKSTFAAIAITGEYYALKNLENYNMLIGMMALAVLAIWNMSEFYFLYKATRE